MNSVRKDFIHNLILQRAEFDNKVKKVGIGKANINIALSKYWGKRDVNLNLPNNSSISISVPSLSSKTVLEVVYNRPLSIFLNGQEVDKDSIFFKRLAYALENFEPFLKQKFGKNANFYVKTYNSVPTAAGLASSSSGFAALIKAINDLFTWQLEKKYLSIIARIFSGSAARSFDDNFIVWHKGELADGADSYAEKVPFNHEFWQNFRIGIIQSEVASKAISSSDAMNITTDTSKLYLAWQQQAERDCFNIIKAIDSNDFLTLGAIAEQNALGMHSTMLSASPAICYWSNRTLENMKKVWDMRNNNKIDAYFTIDAGPNVKVLFMKHDVRFIKSLIPNIHVISPISLPKVIDNTGMSQKKVILEVSDEELKKDNAEES